MHTKSQVQHLKKINVDSIVTGGARLIDAYEQKAHHFANFDVLLQDEAMNDIAQLRHWTIFKIATPEEREKVEMASPANS
jgi:superfamily II DNA/RNA helicase